MVFFWLMLKWRILTWDNLQIRGFHGSSWCYMCEENNESINHLLDECRVADSLWEKGASIFRKNHRHRGWSDITIADWTINSLKTKLWTAFGNSCPSFTLWEIWKTQNKQTFENKARKQEDIWNSIEAHLKETISLQQWRQQEYSAEANERIILCDLGIGELPPNNSIARSIPAPVSSPKS